ncbi:Hypothetical protein, putative [Bodo saltans]|uniref:Uncharacterized protein n=1 Tax=Bodo saltans TaxID=75058 RepID=A0A0S4IND1_BODSA|nr:Hypothetical protein, putative [Bodo saltans]|eukprot:CUE71078.1 Hypothetical protein, putative [Bodo saltans]
MTVVIERNDVVCPCAVAEITGSRGSANSKLAFLKSQTRRRQDRLNAGNDTLSWSSRRFAACSMALVPPADAIFRFFPPHSPVVAFHSKLPSPFLSLHRFCSSREVTTLRFLKESSATKKKKTCEKQDISPNDGIGEGRHKQPPTKPRTVFLRRREKGCTTPCPSGFDSSLSNLAKKKTL